MDPFGFGGERLVVSEYSKQTLNPVLWVEAIFHPVLGFRVQGLEFRV